MAKRPRRNYTHGHLDFAAVLKLAEYPHLDEAGIAGKLGCGEGTLRNKKKYPRFAKALEEIRAGAKEAHRHGEPRPDRRRNGRPMRDE